MSDSSSTMNGHVIATADEQSVSAPSSAPSATTAKITLGNLAPELHIAIAEQCQAQDLPSLRQTCRALARNSMGVFAKRLFHTVRYDLSSASIAKLCALSRETKLARHIKTVKLEIESEPYDRDRDGQRQGRKEVITDLSNALRRLAALGAGQNLALSCHLAPMDLDLVQLALLESDQVFRSLSMDFRIVVPDQRSALRNRSQAQLAQHRSQWAKLETLKLSLDHSWEVAMRDLDVISLIGSTNNLKKLTLTAYEMYNPGNLLNALRAPSLRTLVLKDVVLSTTQLIQCLISHHDSLRELSVLFVELEETAGWSTILQQVRDHMQLEELRLYEVSSEDGFILYFGGARESAFVLELGSPESREKLTEYIEEVVYEEELDSDLDLYLDYEEELDSDLDLYLDSEDLEDGYGFGEYMDDYGAIDYVFGDDTD